MVLGIDTSHYPAPGHATAIPTQAAIDCAWQQGYRFWIVGLQSPPVYLPTLQRLKTDGRFRVEVYEYLYQSQGPESQVRADLERLRQAQLIDCVKRFWIDYEHGAELPGDGEVAQIRHLIGVINSYGVDGGWYSGNWWTQSNISVAGIASLADVPYWIAYYVGGPHPITGTRCHTKQYQGTTTVCGSLNTDLNWRPDDIWQAEQGDDDLDAEGLISLVDSMTPEQLNRLYKVGLKHTPIDIYNPPADAPSPLTDEAWNHYVKDRLAAAGGGAGGGDADHTHPLVQHTHGGIEVD